VSVVTHRWIRRGVLASIGLFIGAVLYVKQPWRRSAAPWTFSTVTAERGAIAAQITAAGTLSARTTVQVGAQVSGRVVELDADFNVAVKRGQVIAKLDDSLLQAQIAQGQAAYDLAAANQNRAEVALADAERQYARQQRLGVQQLVAATTIEGYELTRDTALASVAAARASVAQARANLAQAKTNLSYATIYSPIDGVVLTRSYDLGQTVQSSFSAPTLFTIAADLSRMQIDTAVAEGDVGRLGEGMKATFTVDAYPGTAFAGVVRQVRNSPTTTSGVVTYDAVLDVDNQAGQLRPGMTTSVTFVLDKVDNVIKLPNAALRFKPTRDQIMALMERFGGGGPPGPGGPGGGWQRAAAGAPTGMPPPPPEMGGGPAMPASDHEMIWKLAGDRPQIVPVKLGLTDGSMTQLLEGAIEPGDALITEVQGVSTSPRKLGAF